MPPPLQVDHKPIDLESGVRVTFDVGFLCPILVFLGLSYITRILLISTRSSTDADKPARRV